MKYSDVVTIDGTYGAGKSTTSDHLAKMLGYKRIGTGLMFLVVAKKVLDQKIDIEDKDSICKIADSLDFDFIMKDGETVITVDGKEFEQDISSQELRDLISKVAVIPELREVLNKKQRALAEKGGIVADGRDAGTIIFPDAKWKFFIDADIDVRTKRVIKLVYNEKGKTPPPFDELQQQINDIDKRDMEREIAPLKQADDAVFYDNSDSPDPKQDAIVLYYYITHTEEMLKNTETIKKKLK